MVSSSSSAQANANTLLVSNSPLILTSSAASNHLSPSITQPTNHQFLQLFQNQQQRPFLFSQQPQQMFLPSHNQLLAANSAKSNGTNSPHGQQQQTVFINPNLLNQQQQQFILNKSFLDAQKGKQIILPGHQTPLSANLQQPRSHILQPTAFKSPTAQLLTTQSPLLNPTQFFTSPITWPTNSPIILRPQDGGQLYLHTPNAAATNNNQATTSTPLFVNHQNNTVQNGTVQFVQSSLPTTITTSSSTISPIDANTSNQPKTKRLVKKPKSAKTAAQPKTKEMKNEKEDKKLFLTSPVKLNTAAQMKKDKIQVMRYKKSMSDKILLEHKTSAGTTVRAEREEEVSSPLLEKSLSPPPTRLCKHQIIPKSTQQMNYELLLKKEEFDKIESMVKAKKSAKKEKKNISIVKPRLLLTHNVSGYLIKESNKPFPIDENTLKVDEVATTNTETMSVADDYIENTVNGSPKLKKIRQSKYHSNQLDHSSSMSIQSSGNNQNGSSVHADPKMSTESTVESSDEVKVEVNGENDEDKAYLNKSLNEWEVEDSYKFVLDTTSNKEFAETLKLEEFNGAALKLLTIPILRNFDLKLGPILLLIKKITELKEKFACRSNDEQQRNCSKSSNSNIYEWTVEDVHEFILNLTGKESYANEFKKQEIDGYSLTLLSEDNIRKDLGVAFGASLNIMNGINKFKEQAK